MGPSEAFLVYESTILLLVFFWLTSSTNLIIFVGCHANMFNLLFSVWRVQMYYYIAWNVHEAVVNVFWAAVFVSLNMSEYLLEMEIYFWHEPTVFVIF